MGKVLSIAAALCAALAGALLGGCNTAGCTDNQSSLPLAGFYNSDGNAVSIDSLAVWGVGAPGDSLLLAPSTPASQLYLPLRSTATETSFCFAYRTAELDDPRLQDTLTLAYTSTPWFISEECGAGFRYTITRMNVTHHLIDSVKITDSLATNIDREILRIYFHTAEPEEGSEL
ncbi:MAG: hypothetical protein HDS92_05055 [Bacteroidales bacterium]|nr:hypothetical protein [Bacteroidales bacterium]